MTAAVAELREAAEAGPEVSDDVLAALLERVAGDVDLAATAFSMRPRPKWVSDLLTSE